MPSRSLVECGVAAHDRYGRASNPGGPEARGPSRGLPTCCLYKDLPAKSSQFSLIRPTRRGANTAEGLKRPQPHLEDGTTYRALKPT